jgi:hypothetical protein
LFVEKNEYFSPPAPVPRSVFLIVVAEVDPDESGR